MTSVKPHENLVFSLKKTKTVEKIDNKFEGYVIFDLTFVSIKASEI